MYCTKCGFEIDDNSVFCTNCGHKVGVQAQGGTNFADDIRNSYDSVMSKPKSRLIAGVLAILLGSMGIHEFYLGYTKKGVTHLLMFVFFLGWISQIWAIYEALMILTGRVTTDAKGWPLTD
ncbi:MAG: TM2 domain-containing protein [Oscillospiraceae bacterium]|nr:TM2 domain-containing protein [Oscillospiraceae bacterium]